MRHEQVWLFANTSVETVLMTRPMAAELFEHLGLEPWKMLPASIAELGEEGGIPWPELEKAILGIPVPPSDSEWAVLPLGRLMDHLARQHREFLREYLPAIGHVLSDFAGSDPDSLLHLRMLAQAWPAFAAALSDHIREEEDGLFLRLLRYEACARNDSAQPLGDVPLVRLQDQEHGDTARMRRLLAQALPDSGGPGEVLLEKRLRPLIQAFDAELGRHARLETEVLLPRGIALEKSLPIRHLQGLPSLRERSTGVIG